MFVILFWVMGMENYLTEEFFYDKDFIKMDDVAIAGDCVQQLAAIMMKKQFGSKYNKYAVYMGMYRLAYPWMMRGMLHEAR